MEKEERKCEGKGKIIKGKKRRKRKEFDAFVKRFRQRNVSSCRDSSEDGSVSSSVLRYCGRLRQIRRYSRYLKPLSFYFFIPPLELTLTLIPSTIAFRIL